MNKEEKEIREEDPKEEGAETPTSEGVDYKEELENAKKLLEKKEKQIGQAEHVIEELKSKKGSEIDTSEIEKIIEAKMSMFTEQVRGDAINNLVNSYSSNPDEAELIKYHLKHSIRESGDDEADILNAKALANKTKVLQQASEIKRAEMKMDPEKEKSAGAKTEAPKTPNLSKEALSVAQAFGLTKEELENGYKR